MSLRLCTHIKTNGLKCASPALRHHTLCYFHYQWQRRDQRRIRLGGPIGMNKNSGVELPLLDGPEAILVSIMEIQAALLDQRIPIKMGTALLYSLQLALQAKISHFGLGHSGSVRECPELELELDMERAKAQRPAKEKCAACPKQDTCLSPRNCKKLPKLPAGYRREGDGLICDRSELDDAVRDITPPPSSRAREGSRALCPARETRVEGPAFSPTSATTPRIPETPETTADTLREHSPGRESGVTNRKFPPSRAHARRHLDAADEKQKVLRPRATPSRSAQDAPSSPSTGNRQLATTPYSHNILISNSNPHIDLPGKFPQLNEITREQK